MPRQQKVQVTNKFIRGLITESTALQFPKDACTETFDCTFHKTGRVTRRLGFDKEPNGDSISITSHSETEAFTEFIWKSVGGDGSKTWLVQQQGQIIHFFAIGNSPTANEKLPFTVDLNGFIPNGSLRVPAEFPCQYAQGRGNLVIVNEACEPILVKFNDIDGKTETLITLRERDFQGLNDGLALTERPAIEPTDLDTVNPPHLYNLINQGWYVGGESTAGMADGADILAQWATARNDSPSNADIPSLYRDTTTLTTSETPGFKDVFNADYVAGISTGNTKAPSGHFILRVFNPDRQGVLADEGYIVGPLGGSPVTQRPSAATFFQGRVFYAGVDAPEMNSNIYFTQIIERDSQYGECFQKNDPTNEHFTDLLPDDGGVIKIPEVATVKKLFAYQTSLLVFATNGVWLISGSSQDAFQANDFQIRKLSSVGTNSPLSFVDVRGVPFWWAEDGIYTITFDPNYNSFAVISISSDTIQSFFREVPAGNRRFVKGTYCVSEERIHWMFHHEPTDRYEYSRVLLYNAVTKAFFPWTISEEETIRVRGIFYNDVSSSNEVVKYTFTREFAEDLPTLMIFAAEFNQAHKDWFDLGVSVDYRSYFITGYDLQDSETQRFVQTNYIFVFVEPAENASCFVRGVFDYARSPNTGKWSSRQQVYNDNLLDRNVGYRRLKIRGKGRVLQYLIESDSGKPFTVIGWSPWNTSNAGL